MAKQTFSTLMTSFCASAAGTLRVACVAGLCLGGAGFTAAHAGEQDYAEAIQQFRDGRLADAYGRFRELANHGDADAARIAIFMYKFGPSLYGRQWDLTPHQVQAWETLAKSASAREELPVLTYVNQSPAAKLAGMAAQ